MRQTVRAIELLGEIAARHKLKPPFSTAFVGPDGVFNHRRYDLLTDARAFQDFQKRLVDVLESEPNDMRKFVIRFFSLVDYMVETPKEAVGEEWIN